MFAERLNAQLLAALDRPDLRVLGQDRRIAFDASLDTEFLVGLDGAIVLGAPCLGSARLCALHLRHALELSVLLEAVRERQTDATLDRCGLAMLAGLSAARTASLFWELDGSSAGAVSTCDAAPSWQSALAAARMPDEGLLRMIWSRLRHLQGAGTAPLPAPVAARLRQIWELLGPTEMLMAQGGDARLAIDPRTGLNHYGCSHRPRPWAITFASSTASSLSERGFGGAEASRRRLAAEAVCGRAALVLPLEAERVRAGISAHYDLSPGCEVLLAASGTDCELLVLAMSEIADPRQMRPVTSILTAPEETGTGVPLAAAGRHFASDTSGRQCVDRGAAIPGFRTDTEVLTLSVRRADGSLRPADEIERDCAGMVERAQAAGRQILLHLLDLSKTGLLAPSIGCIERLANKHVEGLDIVVDCCQARLDRCRVQDYLARGWMVMITGSKFFTGPPFCGAVLLPAEIAGRLAGGSELPAGLAAYGGRSDWPRWVEAASSLPASVNLGMVLRWQAALAEMAAFAAVPRTERAHQLEFFLGGVREAISAHPQLELIEVPAPARGLVPADQGGPEPLWDQLQTIIGFLVRDPQSGTPLKLEQARLIYRALNADVAHLLAENASEPDRALARLLCHIGQPAPLMHPALEAHPAGVLRISAGARLLSGEPSHAGLGSTRRLAREIADARLVLEKITLLLRLWPVLQHAEPEPSYAPRG